MNADAEPTPQPAPSEPAAPPASPPPAEPARAATEPDAPPQAPPQAAPALGAEEPAPSPVEGVQGAAQSAAPSAAQTKPRAVDELELPPVVGLPRSGPPPARAGVTVLQPLAPLPDGPLPTRPPPAEDPRALLATWSNAMEQALREGRPADGVRLAHVLLRQLPRHLATYHRLIRAAWMLRRWEEGDAWGRRLLRADPANALAWRAVAMAAEQRGERARAHARWQRAFECDPYEPEIRAGLVRTSVDLARLPQLNEAALATLLLRGYRWEQAAALYRSLVQQENRLDYQTGLLLARWQIAAREAARSPEPDASLAAQAYDQAHALSQEQPYLLAAWVVLDDLGDENDNALARHPLGTMDPDGDYIRSCWAIPRPARAVRLIVGDEDKALLAEVAAPAPAAAPAAS